MAAPDRGFETYRDRYEHVRLTRRDGIVEARIHSQGASLKWCGSAHDELGFCFADIAHDPENKVLILTGEGDVFCDDVDPMSFGEFSARGMFHMHEAGRRLIDNLLNIPVPVIGAVNGPAHIHAELLLLSNIVIASEDASFQDNAHMPIGIAPGDGVHVAWPALLGNTRGSYFLLMGECLDVATARDFGVVHEIVPKDRLLVRAWEVAGQIAAKPVMASRYARLLLTQEMKRLMHRHLSHGIAAECLAMLDQHP
jgi:enoyl-CoA hydratase/carnithine racemase